MKIEIFTIFPEMFTNILDTSILARAQAGGILEVNIHDIREYSADKHRKTDAYPFGGGAGMLMSPQPVFDAIEDIGAKKRMIYMSPRGEVLNEKMINALAEEDEILILCGHYEGMDQRILDYYSFEEISIGDYILTGGEIPAMVLMDSVVRLLPDALGSENAHDEESVYSGLLEYPQYTRPASFETKNGENLEVPEVLMSGNHKEIRLWNFRKSLELTAERRPDLLKAFAEKHLGVDAKNSESGKELLKEEKKILEEFVK